MKRSEVTAIVAQLRQGAPAITGPGATSGMLWAEGHEAATIYNMEMGYATPMSLGVALALPHELVIALEGEGSAIAGVPALATIGRYQPANLIVIVFDNHVYGTGGGGVETATAHGTDIAALARACGIEKATTVSELHAAKEALRRAFTQRGPWLIVAEIDKSDTINRPLPDLDHVEAAASFRNELARRRDDAHG